MPDPSESRPLCPDGVFATTHWSVVLCAGGQSHQAMAALERLCRGYWYPLYAHIRRRGYPPEEAEDLTQEFFASLLRHDSLASIRKEKGRFRTFLLTSLNYFLADIADKRRAAKRGGGRKMVEWDALEAEERYGLEPVAGESPDQEFDRRWAAALIERALENMRNEQVAAGNGPQFERLKVFLSRETIPGEYESAGSELGLSPNAVAAAVRRLRVRFRELAYAEAMHTVASPAQAEEEFKSLWG